MSPRVLDRETTACTYFAVGRGDFARHLRLLLHSSVGLRDLDGDVVQQIVLRHDLVVRGLRLVLESHDAIVEGIQLPLLQSSTTRLVSLLQQDE